MSQVVVLLRYQPFCWFMGWLPVTHLTVTGSVWCMNLSLTPFQCDRLRRERGLLAFCSATSTYLFPLSIHDVYVTYVLYVRTECSSVNVCERRVSCVRYTYGFVALLVRFFLFSFLFCCAGGLCFGIEGGCYFLLLFQLSLVVYYTCIYIYIYLGVVAYGCAWIPVLD